MKELNRQLWLTVYYRQLNTSTTSTITGVLNFEELIAQIRRAPYPWRTTQIAGDAPENTGSSNNSGQVLHKVEVEIRPEECQGLTP